MLVQGTQEWLDIRKTKIGASDTACIMGNYKYKTPYSLWMEKLGLQEAPPMNDAMKRGHQLEPIARDWFENKMRSLFSPEVILEDTPRPYMMASLDGINFDRTILIEIKNVNKRDHEIACTGSIPDLYYPQVQHQLACVKSAKCLYYISYDENNPDKSAVVEVTRDDKFIEKMLKKLDKFWDLVISKKAPEMTEKDLRIIDDISIQSKIQRLKELDKLSKEYDELKKELRNFANGSSYQYDGVKILSYPVQGSVDYSLIPELQSIDLDKYRKPSRMNTRITIG